MRSNALMMAILLGGCAGDFTDGPLQRHTAELTQLTVTNNPAGLNFYRSVPMGLAASRPVVVLMHGCNMTAAELQTAWPQWETLATEREFSLLYVEQTAQNNPQRCFNWFVSQNQARDTGEVRSLISAIDALANPAVDVSKVYVVGFSAGAAFAVNSLAAAPDRFSAGVAAAGVPYGCATSVSSAFGCMYPGVNETPSVLAARVSGASRGAAKSRLAIFQGQTDSTVAPLNGRELMEQWTSWHGLDQQPESTDTVTGGGTRTRHGGTSVTPLVELNEASGLGHSVRIAWATDMADFFSLTAAPVGGSGGVGGTGGTPGGEGGLGGVAGSTGGSGGSGGAAGGTGGVGGSASSVPPRSCAHAPATLSLLALLWWSRRRSLRTS